jgi:hypothetical protein
MDSGLKTSRGGDHGDSRPRDDNDGELQIRTMEIPEWLSNLDVTSEFVCCRSLFVSSLFFLSYTARSLN